MLGLSAAIISCKKPNETTDLAPETYKDVAYGSTASQKMDVYLSEGRNTTDTKVIILIHGGGWSSGDKNDFIQFIDTLKKRLPGYAIYNINYRLAAGSGNLFPTQENDVKSAIEFIYSKKEDHKVSDKYVLLGASAGGHLALLHAYKYVAPVKIKAVVDFFGPSDLTEMYNNPASLFAPPSAVAAVVGGTPTSNPLIYQQSSPINFVDGNSPPTIILQGGADVLVAPNQSILLKNKLAANGVVHQYVLYPSENHGWTGANMVDSFDKIAAFLLANVQ